ADRGKEDGRAVSNTHTRQRRPEEHRSGARGEEDGTTAPVPRSRPSSKVEGRSGAGHREDEIEAKPLARERRERSVVEGHSSNVRMDTKDKAVPTTRPRDTTKPTKETASSNETKTTKEKENRGIVPPNRAAASRALVFHSE